MINSKYVKCTDCQHQYRLRFNVGNTFPQKGTFKCKVCGANLEFGYDKSRKIFMVGLETTAENEPATVQNLHPELPIEPGREADPFYFPSPDYIMKYNAETRGSFDAFRKGQKSMMNFKQKLDEVIGPFRYLKEQRWAMLEKRYGRNNDQARKKILKEALEVGRYFLEGKWHALYRDVLSEAERAKRQAGFANLKTYLTGRNEEFLIEKMYALLEAYNEVYHELLPTLLTQKFNMSPEGNSSAANWKKIEMVYGKLYETYGDLLVLPTAINNLLQRGDYELFQSSPGFSFSNYLDSDKAGRCKNFIANDKLKGLEEHYDAGIRNATHHQASKADKEDQEITLLTGKGGRTERKMSLVEYIAHCNELFARCLILFNVYYKLTN